MFPLVGSYSENGTDGQEEMKSRSRSFVLFVFCLVARFDDFFDSSTRADPCDPFVLLRKNRREIPDGTHGAVAALDDPETGAVRRTEGKGGHLDLALSGVGFEKSTAVRFRVEKERLAEGVDPAPFRDDRSVPAKFFVMAFRHAKPGVFAVPMEAKRNLLHKKSKQHIGFGAFFRNGPRESRPGNVSCWLRVKRAVFG